MFIELLRVAGVRCVAQAELELSAGLNLVLGANGAGKTSLLEATYLISHGHSFRAGSRETLIGRGADGLQVFARVRHDEGGLVQRLGLERRAGTWSGRLDDRSLERLTDLFRACAVCCFEPGSHELVAGPAEERRAFLDWGVFHVEPEFLGQWRRYQGALKQRNALLKQGGPSRMLDTWDHELAEAGEPLTSRRQHYLERLQQRTVALAASLAPQLGIHGLDLSPGWRRHELPLADALLLARERDRQAGYTSVGPHRADWSVDFHSIPGRDALSRGQAKLTALACLLAQAEDYAEQRGEWPVIALDDLASELDRTHQARVLERLLNGPAQIFITATETPAALQELTHIARFHVEHAQIVAVP